MSRLDVLFWLAVAGALLRSGNPADDVTNPPVLMESSDWHSRGIAGINLLDRTMPSRNGASFEKPCLSSAQRHNSNPHLLGERPYVLHGRSIDGQISPLSPPH